jgi:hypothetical protein
MYMLLVIQFGIYIYRYYRALGNTHLGAHRWWSVVQQLYRCKFIFTEAGSYNMPCSMQGLEEEQAASRPYI